ncbi:MAG: hypothetical protein ABI867_01370 [Kofleriaceae bacterium]
MTKLIILLALVGSASIATAQRTWATAGTRGTVTAYELDGRTVIDHKTCLSSGRYSWDYPRCGNRLRDSVKLELCRTKGAGTHHYLYQLGDGRPSRASVYCSRRY